jgi:hypothetical protein
MNENDAILDDRTCLEALAAFAPRLRETGTSFGAMSQPKGDGSAGNPIQMPYWHHSDLSQEFMAMAYKSGWVSGEFDWMKWSSSEESKRLGDPAAIALADVDQLTKLITKIMRMERFGEGYIGSCFKRGMLLAIAERAEAILRSGEGFSGTYKHRPW